ncbi:PocR ligand-binding domain-containing protein [Geomobilimonas luticola]|uniref:histidine kinase n=1 Tax=Geomobilimonas luticola TaxID=1114878 RepID=A0ABS5SGV0_9BACT|nr:PocR ligand-binding domain-containing protein [Geomobilimonas luticola]MBT0654592.1 transporter substrate-binding domain-containing protein [Geomobilimonas luticola]
MIIRLLIAFVLIINSSLAYAQESFNKVLVVGSEEDFPPFAIGRTDETASGYTVELWEQVAGEVGLRYTIRVRPWAQILQEFQDGKIDVLINVAQSEERHRYIDFSVPHVTVHGAIFVRKDTSGIRSEKDLAGKSLIVFKSDLAHEYALAKGWQQQLVVVNTAQEGLKLLASGQHDAMLLSKLSGLQTIRELKIDNVKPLEVNVGYAQKFSFGVHKHDHELLAQLNEGLALTKASGAYDKIYQKWFGVYETRQPTLRDILPYLVPFIAISLGIAGYNFRKRRIERKQARAALLASEQNLRLILNSAGEGIYGIDLDGNCTFCNSACVSLLGYNHPDELIGKNMHRLIHHTHPDGTPYQVEECCTYQTFTSGQGLHIDDEVLWRADGSSFPVEYHSYPQFKEGRTIGAVITFTDITERKFKESAHRQAGHLLLLASTYNDLHECMAALTASLQDLTGCEAVGIRLQVGDDFPYFETRGFPAEFVAAEHQLCTCGPDGKILRDGTGHPVLECMCGNVIQGRFDPAAPFFTRSGSFWSNSTTALLASSSEADRQARTRNRCNGEGYESVALVPMHAGERIIGLMQFNDHRKDRFTPALIDILEGLADKVALAMAQRQAEKELLEREKLYHDLLDTIPDLIWLKNPDGVYLSCNATFERFFGASEAAILGKTDYDFVDKELADFFRTNDRKVMAAGKPCHNEEWITFADDSHRALLYTTKVPMHDTEGKLVGILGVGRDITARVEYEERVRSLNDRLQLATSSARLGVWDWDVRTNTMEWDDRMFELYGITSDTFPSNIDAWLNGLHPDDKELAVAECQAALRGEKEFDTTFRVQHPDGTVKYIKANGLVIRQPDGTAVRMTGVNADITERKRAEEALQRSESTIRNKLRAILEPEGDISSLELSDIIDCDMLRSMLEDFYKLTGILGAVIDTSGNVLVAVGWQDICTKFHRCHPETLKNCIESDTVLTDNVPVGEFRQYRCKNNMWDMVTPLEVGGKHIGNVFIGQFFFDDEEVDVELFRKQAQRFGFDETEYLAALSRVPRISREMAHWGMQFYAKLTQIISSLSFSSIKVSRMLSERINLEHQLQQAQKMEVVGQLAGGVAHDFNNILTVISGYCSLLKMDYGLNDQQKQRVEAIAGAAEKAAQLTHGLLAFSRKQPLIMRQENLNDIVHHIHKFLARIIGEDITFSTACSNPELSIVADRGQIEQVLINLATNARDAMPNGGSFTVTSGLAELDSSFVGVHKYNVPPGKYALLTVSDTGIGIKKEDLAHIFEPFFTTKEVGKGTGLGMAIIYGIVKQHNGFINVYSEVGQGTTFRIYLPIMESNDKPATVNVKENILPMGGKETILLAEDDPAVRTLVSTILSSSGYEVILAEDGDEAIEKFKQHHDKINLLLIDMIMPKKNGRETVEEIQRIKPGVKVLFTSGYTADFIQRRGVSEEGIELLMKPVQPTILLRKLREILDT